MDKIVSIVTAISDAIKNLMVWWREYVYYPPSEKVIKKREDLAKEKKLVEETGERPKWD